jgi:hypothetical protein
VGKIQAPKNINMSTDNNTDKTDPNEKDDLGLAQFSPEVLEFMLGVLRAQKAKHRDDTETNALP